GSCSAMSFVLCSGPPSRAGAREASVLRSTFALRASVDSLRSEATGACHPKLAERAKGGNSNRLREMRQPRYNAHTPPVTLFSFSSVLIAYDCALGVPAWPVYRCVVDRSCRRMPAEGT